MDKLPLPFEIKSVEDDGTFHGIASVYGVEDLGGDVIEKGAFKKTIAENPTVPVLWQHDAGEVIGVGTVKEHQGKLLIDAQLDMEDERARGAHRKMKKGLIKGLSIGFNTIRQQYEEIEGKFVRHILELKLWEVSVVTFPMLPSAQVTRVKSIEDLAAREAELEAELAQIRALQAKKATSGTPDAGEGDGAANPEAAPPEWHPALIELRNAIPRG